jgi:hypothetical protein
MNHLAVLRRTALRRMMQVRDLPLREGQEPRLARHLHHRGPNSHFLQQKKAAALGWRKSHGPQSQPDSSVAVAQQSDRKGHEAPEAHPRQWKLER